MIKKTNKRLQTIVNIETANNIEKLAKNSNMSVSSFLAVIITDYSNRNIISKRTRKSNKISKKNE